MSDASFKWKDLQGKALRNFQNIENSFTNTSLSVILKGYGSVIPDAPGAESHPLTQSLAEKVGKFVKEYVEAMEKVRNIIWTLVWHGYLS